MSLNIGLRYVEPDGTLGDFMTDLQSLEFGDDYSDVGSVTFTYPSQGVHSELITHQAEFAIMVNSNEIFNGRFRVEQWNDQTVTDDPVVKTYSGRTLLGLFDSVSMHPPGWAVDNPAQPALPYTHTDRTPGFIMQDLILKAQNDRGALAWLAALNFGGRFDSNYAVWNFDDIDVTWDLGMSYLKVLEWLRDKGYAEYKMFGRELRLYNRNYGIDRFAQEDPVILTLGTHITEAPSQQSSQDLCTRVIVKGDEDYYTIVVDGEAEAKWGVFERVTSVSGVIKEANLAVAGKYFLERFKQERSSVQYGLNMESGIDPFFDFQVGDWIGVDYQSIVTAEFGPARLRIRKLALSLADGQPLQAALVVNDWFDEKDISIARQLDRMGGTA